MDFNKKQKAYLNINFELESYKFCILVPTPTLCQNCSQQFNKPFKELDVYKLNSPKDKRQIIDGQ